MIIVSIKTMYERLEMLKVNISNLLKQKDWFDKLIIVIDNNLTKDQYKEYYEFKKLDDKVSILIEDDHKWRSCNKLLPVMKRYPEDDIITMDDDTYYPEDTIKLLVQKHNDERFKKLIIAHISSQLFFTNVNEKYQHFIGYLYSIGINVNSVTYNKYLSNATLFPAHTFDNTDIWNYDKMMELTEGVHDELWFWINSTKKGIPCYQLDKYVYFTDDMKVKWKGNEYRLAYEIVGTKNIKKFSYRINTLYYDDIINHIWYDTPIIYISDDNLYNFLFYTSEFSSYYPMGINIEFEKNISISNKKYALKVISANKKLLNIIKHIYELDENDKNKKKYKDIRKDIIYCESAEKYMELKKEQIIDF